MKKQMHQNVLGHETMADIREYFEKAASCNELEDSAMPSPDLIWWRSQLAEKRQLARRSLIAIETVRIGAVAVSAAFVVLAMVFWTPRLFSDLPFPLPLTVGSLIVFGCSTCGILLAWARRR